MSSFAIPVTWLSPTKSPNEQLEAQELPKEPHLGNFIEVVPPSRVLANGPRAYEVNVHEAVFASVFGLREPKAISPQPEAITLPQVVDLPQGLTAIAPNDLEEMERDLLAMSEESCVIDIVGAHAEGFSVDRLQPLRMIKGIGPKTLARLEAANIKTFPDLADASVSQLRLILLGSGPYHRLAKPSDWIKQANLAAVNQWPALRQHQGSAKQLRRHKAA